MRKVLIATPAYDGRCEAWYTISLVNSVRLAQAENIYLHPVLMSYDALIQRARNDLFRLAIEGDYDDMIWIDSDQGWEPEWILELLACDKDVVGGTARKKTDREELYAVKTKNLIEEDGLIKVEGVGLAFLKMSRKAYRIVWDNAPAYQNEGREGRMCCDVRIVNGQLVGEDIAVTSRLREHGIDVWLNPKMTCPHVGTKVWYGDFAAYVKRLLEQKKAA